MKSIFEKLKVKGQEEILVVNAPASFEPEIAALKGVKVFRDARQAGEVAFALLFVTTKQQIDAAATWVGSKMVGDAPLWFAYPKGTSRKYSCDFNRDTGWEALGSAGFERVSQVAVDEDWSALRLRRVEFIKTMARKESFAMTDKGKAKARSSGAGSTPRARGRSGK